MRGYSTTLSFYLSAQDNAADASQPHKLEDVGSNPTPAISGALYILVDIS